MAKVAYLQVTDLHIDYNKANRVNYFNEILTSLTDIIAISESYKKKGYITKLILLGDVFDGSISNSSDAMQAIEILRYLCSNFTETFAVVGNHEITYAKDNPFWFLVPEIADASLANARRYLQPRGLDTVIKVVDQLDDGDTHFYFNHYGVAPKVPSMSGVRIGLFHQNVGSNDICKMWGTFDNVEDASYIQAYSYCFFGHMHKAKGKYYLNEAHTCLGEWLGTIGRTKVDEVDANDLEVNIPTVLVCDGCFCGIEDNPIYLQPPAVCIDFERLRASQKTNEVVQARKEFASNTFVGHTLLETLQGAVQGTPLEFLIGFLNDGYDNVLHYYKQTLTDEATMSSEDAEEDSDGE